MAENFEPMRARTHGYGDRPNRTDRTRSLASKRRTQDLKRLRKNKRSA